VLAKRCHIVIINKCALQVLEWLPSTPVLTPQLPNYIPTGCSDTSLVVKTNSVKLLQDRDQSFVTKTKTGRWNIKQVPSVKRTNGYPHMPILRPLAARRFVWFWAFGGAKFPKMHGTPVNFRAKFDAASFILAGEIRSRTTTKTNKKQ